MTPTTTTPTTTPTDPDQVATALDRLQRAREIQEMLAPLRRMIADADEEARAAAVAGSAAGLSERAIAGRLGITQPTVHSWMDDRRSAPLPPPSVASQAWTLHHVVSAAASQVMRLRGYQLPNVAPTPGHMVPTTATAAAYEDLDNAADRLGKLAAALDYTGRAA